MFIGAQGLIGGLTAGAFVGIVIFIREFMGWEGKK